VAKLVDAAVFKTETFRGYPGSKPGGATTQEKDMARSSTMQSMLHAKLDTIQRQIEVLRGQEKMVIDMIRDLSTEPSQPATAKVRATRSNVKSAVLDLLERVGQNGLNAAIAVEMASQDNVNLDRGSVSSLLSRLKNDKVVSYDGSLYRLTPKDVPNVHPLRTPGAAMK